MHLWTHSAGNWETSRLSTVNGDVGRKGKPKGIAGDERAGGVVQVRNVRRAAHVSRWWKTSRTAPSGVRSQKAGVTPRRASKVLEKRKEVTGRILLESDAGQGVHREVESEGFAANHRAVAEIRHARKHLAREPGDLLTPRRGWELRGAAGSLRA